MQQTPFHSYYTARKLCHLSDDDRFVSAFASSDIKVYPFQIAAAAFALRSPYQKGVVLCDEAGMGKSHEAMLVITQKWLEGQSRILIAIPNADLLMQWIEMFERFYTVPYVVVSNRSEWERNVTAENPNAFDQNAIVISTYDFVADNESAAKEINWDLTVFEEAGALSSCYQEDNKQAKAIKRIAGNAYKLLLTGTPIEKNIMDLYGLIWFIDETVLPCEQEFLSRYLRKPENYPELSERVSKFCFRTLRSQAKSYAKVTERVLLTDEYTPSQPEQKLYDLLFAYINKPEKLAFPEMNSYDLALRLLSLQSSSTAAVLQTVNGIIGRLKNTDGAENELAEWEEIKKTAENITVDTKAKHLLTVLKNGFTLMKQKGAKKKAVIFTESTQTQKMLAELLSDKYKVYIYNGQADYSAIARFKSDGEILLTTDNGAKGFNLEDAAFIIHYDLPYNTLKMEQRIDRCHRLGQQNDVLSLAFINKGNLSDVRKLELVNKRMLVADGVFGLSDDVIGGFTQDLSAGLEDISQRIRTTEQVEQDYLATLDTKKTQNTKLVSAAEDILFTTFSEELKRSIKLTPQYVAEKSAEINDALWNITKWFFNEYNQSHTDCYFEIDDNAKTVMATKYEKLPVLFYYWNGSRNAKYVSQKLYYMENENLPVGAPRPRHGRITLTSIIGHGILHELECADRGQFTIHNSQCIIESCLIGLYNVSISGVAEKSIKEIPVLVGKTQSGGILNTEQCESILSLPVSSFTESEHKSPHWLKSSAKPHELDNLVDTEELLRRESEKLNSAGAEEIDRIKRKVTAKKSTLSREIEQLYSQLQKAEDEYNTVSGDRLKRLAAQKNISLLKQKYMQKQESQFFDEMRFDIESEQEIENFKQSQKLTAKVTREFVVEVEPNVL